MLSILAFGAVLVLAGCVWVVWYHWDSFQEARVAREDERLSLWAIKGVGIPLIAWVLFNLTAAPGRVVTLPEVVVSKLTWMGWMSVLGRLVVPVLLVISTFWAAATLAWLLVHLVARTESRREIVGASVFWGLVLSPLVVGIVWVGGWYASGFALMLLFTPLLRDLLALGTPKKLGPAYTRALQRIKSGRYADAEMEVIRQLERSENDFEGWLMLARLYAVNFGDLPEAERTVREICGQKDIARKEYCTALLHLGDWYWMSGEPQAAYRVWAEVCEKFPMSDFATTARQKIRQLGE